MKSASAAHVPANPDSRASVPSRFSACSAPPNPMPASATATIRPNE